MFHTFVAKDEAFVRARCTAVQELSAQLHGSSQAARLELPAFRQRRRRGERPSTGSIPLRLSDSDIEALLEHAFERYYETSGLFGTPEGCLAMVDRLKDIGVDEIACLIDFGVPPKS